MDSPSEEIPVFGTAVEGWPHVLRPSAYAVVRNAEGELATVQTANGCFLPGGGSEPEESPEQTVEREAREECGLVLAPRAVLGQAVEFVYSPEEKVCFEKRSIFLEADYSGLVAPVEQDHQLVWLNLDQAADALSYESHRWAVRRLGPPPAPPG